MINLNQLYLVTGFIILFGIMGLRRGISRELLSLVGIFLAMVVGKWGAPSLQPWVNRSYKLVIFALKGGMVAEDPGSVLTKIGNLKLPVTTKSDLLILGTAVFGLIVLAFYLLGEFVIKPPKKASQRLLGIILAGMNGYFIAYFLIPRHLPTPKATIRISTSGMMDLLSQNLIKVVLGFVLIMIFLGLQMSTRPRKPD
jgi:uncharacterized membrane protein required for colicin V production